MKTKIQEWPNGLGAEVTIKSRRVSIQDHGASGFAVAVRRKPATCGEDANVFYKVNPARGLSWAALAVWGYTAWKLGA